MATKLGLDCTVTPRKLMSDVLSRYARALQNSMGSKVETLYKLVEGKAEALEFKVIDGSKTIGIPFKDIVLKPSILIAGITRGRKTIIPSGNDMILAGDRVIVVAANQRLQDLNDILM
jgi:trk system potassium uptake protein TrkA